MDNLIKSQPKSGRRKPMKNSFSILIILLLLTGPSSGQQILKSFEFNQGGYYICILQGPSGTDRGIPTFDTCTQYPSDTTSFFYTSDTVILNRLKKEVLLYKKPSENGISIIYHCGYPDLFCVFKDGRLLLRFPANIECGYMNTSMGQMLFKSKTLQKYKVRFRPLVVNYTCIDNTTERLNFIEKIQKDSSIVSYKVFPGKIIETVQLK